MISVQDEVAPDWWDDVGAELDSDQKSAHALAVYLYELSKMFYGGYRRVVQNNTDEDLEIVLYEKSTNKTTYDNSSISFSVFKWVFGEAGMGTCWLLL